MKWISPDGFKFLDLSEVIAFFYKPDDTQISLTLRSSYDDLTFSGNEAEEIWKMLSNLHGGARHVVLPHMVSLIINGVKIYSNRISTYGCDIKGALSIPLSSELWLKTKDSQGNDSKTLIHDKDLIMGNAGLEFFTVPADE